MQSFLNYSGIGISFVAYYCAGQQNNPYYFSLNNNLCFVFTLISHSYILALLPPSDHAHITMNRKPVTHIHATKTWMGLSVYQTAHRGLNASSISRIVTYKNFTNNLNVSNIKSWTGTPCYTAFQFTTTLNVVPQTAVNKEWWYSVLWLYISNHRHDSSQNIFL